MNAIRTPYLLLLTTWVALATCSSPSAPVAGDTPKPPDPEPPPVPTSVHADIRVVDMEENPLSGSTVWLLDSEGRIRSKRTIQNEPVRFVLDTGADYVFLAYRREFRISESTFTTSRDTMHGILLLPATEERTVDVAAKWSNGESAPITGLKAMLSYRDVVVDSFLAGSVATRVQFPVVSPEMQVRITAADSDTLTLSIGDLSAPSTPVVLNRISPQPPLNIHFTIRSMWGDRRTGLPDAVIAVQDGLRTIVTDANGFAVVPFDVNKPLTFIASADGFQPYSGIVPTGGPKSYFLFLTPAQETLVPLFDVYVGMVWHFTGINSSTYMGLRTKQEWTGQWELIELQSETAGSTLLTFRSTLSGISTSTYGEPKPFERTDTIRIRESVGGQWTAVSANSYFPLNFAGRSVFNTFDVGIYGYDFTDRATIDWVDGMKIDAIRSHFNRFGPEGVNRVTATRFDTSNRRFVYIVDQRGLLQWRTSSGGGNSLHSNTMDRYFPEE